MKILKSKKGFTLIELLVVIGILAVLAAIAIPSVAGLIDRANVSADATNANEMTNAIERFTSEYELYCQDLASGKIDTDNLDAAQGRVFNVTGADDRADIELLEGAGLNGKQINIDTKYPENIDTLQAVVENYMKTSSTTFTPKQSDSHYFYNPDCGLVVCAETGSSVDELNALVQSGKDAKGNTLTPTATWVDVTSDVYASAGAPVFDPLNHSGIIPEGAKYIRNIRSNDESYGPSAGCPNCAEWCHCEMEVYTAGEQFPSGVEVGDVYFYNGYGYMFGFAYDGASCPFSIGDGAGNYIDAVVTLDPSNVSGWQVAIANQYAYGGKTIPTSEILMSINGTNVTNMQNTFTNCIDFTYLPTIPTTITKFSLYQYCYNIINVPTTSLKLPCHLNTADTYYDIGSTDGGWTYETLTVEHYHYSGCGHN